MINNNNNNHIKSEMGGMGVAWFVQDSSSETVHFHHRLNHNNNLKTHKDNNTKVDLIDIEDEDHSFAAFFIGMKTGPSPYVKRPLVLYCTRV